MAVLLAENSDLLTLERMTLKNPHLKVNGVNNQAETIYFNGTTQRLVAKNMDFISRQDTLQLNAYSWFYNTLIAGDVDFIWGSAKAALFENSEIRTVVDSTDASKGGYLVQARVTSPADKGYVFLNSRLTREADVPDGLRRAGAQRGQPGLLRQRGVRQLQAGQARGCRGLVDQSDSESGQCNGYDRLAGIRQHPSGWFRAGDGRPRTCRAHADRSGSRALSLAGSGICSDWLEAAAPDASGRLRDGNVPQAGRRLIESWFEITKPPETRKRRFARSSQRCIMFPVTQFA